MFIFIYLFLEKGILVPLPRSLALCCLPPQSASLTGLTNKNHSTNAIFSNIKNVTKTMPIDTNMGIIFLLGVRCVFFMGGNIF